MTTEPCFVKAPVRQYTTQAEIAATVGITEVTVRNRSKELEKNLERIFAVLIFRPKQYPKDKVKT